MRRPEKRSLLSCCFRILHPHVASFISFLIVPCLKVLESVSLIRRLPKSAVVVIYPIVLAQRKSIIWNHWNITDIMKIFLYSALETPQRERRGQEFQLAKNMPIAHNALDVFYYHNNGEGFQRRLNRFNLQRIFKFRVLNSPTVHILATTFLQSARCFSLRISFGDLYGCASVLPSPLLPFTTA